MKRPSITINDVTETLERNGFQYIRRKGGHLQYRKDGHPNIITVPNNTNRTLPRGLVGRILRLAGLRDKI